MKPLEKRHSSFKSRGVTINHQRCTRENHVTANVTAASCTGTIWMSIIHIPHALPKRFSFTLLGRASDLSGITTPWCLLQFWVIVNLASRAEKASQFCILYTTNHVAMWKYLPRFSDIFRTLKYDPVHTPTVWSSYWLFIYNNDRSKHATAVLCVSNKQINFPNIN